MDNWIRSPGAVLTLRSWLRFCAPQFIPIGNCASGHGEGHDPRRLRRGDAHGLIFFGRNRTGQLHLKGLFVSVVDEKHVETNPLLSLTEERGGGIGQRIIHFRDQRRKK
jgi:hypothetical protein